MSFWQFLNQWWNLPYLVMLGLVAVFFAMQTLGLVAHGADHEQELDHDLDHDIDQEIDHDVDHDVDHDADHDQDVDHEAEESFSLAAFLGIGRVPFMVVWLTLFIFAGFTGLFFNRIASASGYRPWMFPLSLLASAIAGIVSVRFASRAVGKLVDTGGRGSSRREELTGAIGVVASPRLDATFGEVRIRDPRGNELIVHGHLGDGEPALPQGEKVVLVELEKDSGLFHVTALKE